MYRLYHNTVSPYCAKSSAMIGYAGLPCELVAQNIFNRFASIQRLTGKTMVPVLRRGEWAINDSSDIAGHVIDRSDRPMLPADEALAPICWLLEDFADEWVSLWVLGSRWANERDADTARRSIGRELAGGLPGLSRVAGRAAGAAIAAKVAKGGACEANLAALERSRDRLLQAMETTLEREPGFLFESYPTVADFAFYGQLVQFWRDPSGHDTLRIYPNVRDYLGRIEPMELPHPAAAHHRGPARQLGELSSVFAEFLGTYWRVLVASHRAYHQKRRPESVEVELLDGSVFSARPSGYLAGRLAFVLGQLDDAYAAREELFGGKGLEIEHALIQQVARLTDYAAGRELLRGFEHIAKS